MGETAKKVWKNILKVVGSFFGDLPNWLHVLWITVIGGLIFWDSGWDWWLMVKLFVIVLWCLVGIIVTLLIIRKIQDKSDKK